jgi:tRNA (guanine37-N1)-methyltransferase
VTRNFSFLTIHPTFLESYFEFGVFRSAFSKGIANFMCVNLRDFAVDKHGSVDDRPYGGGEGMVMRPEPLKSALDLVKPDRVIHLSPSGKKWNWQEAEKLSKSSNDLAFVCSRFDGIDQRFIDHYVTDEYSIGDFVISGGELAALVIVDSILRAIPDVLGNASSYQNDSFGTGMASLLEHPLYTRPQVFEGLEVPAVLLSGDHQKIDQWRKDQARLKTKRLRPDLIKD